MCCVVVYIVWWLSSRRTSKSHTKCSLCIYIYILLFFQSNCSFSDGFLCLWLVTLPLSCEHTLILKETTDLISCFTIKVMKILSVSQDNREILNMFSLGESRLFALCIDSVYSWCVLVYILCLVCLHLEGKHSVSVPSALRLDSIHYLCLPCLHCLSSGFPPDKLCVYTLHWLCVYIVFTLCLNVVYTVCLHTVYTELRHRVDSALTNCKELTLLIHRHTMFTFCLNSIKLWRRCWQCLWCKSLTVY